MNVKPLLIDIEVIKNSVDIMERELRSKQPDIELLDLCSEIVRNCSSRINHQINISDEQAELEEKRAKKIFEEHYLTK